MYSRDLEYGHQNHPLTSNSRLWSSDQQARGSKCCKCFPIPCSLSWSFSLLFIVFSMTCLMGVYLGNSLIFYLIVISGWFISLALHEFAHAFVAYRGGDSSVVDKGYLDLDLLRYTDPLMTFAIPTLILLFGGMALPGGAVTVMISNVHGRKWKSLVSLAGPLSNFLFAICISIILKFCLIFIPKRLISEAVIGPALSVLISYQITATVLNLFPFPPLDGWGALSPWLPEDFFLKRWMKNPWHAKSITLISFLLIFFGFRFIPGALWTVHTLTDLFVFDLNLLDRGSHLMAVIFSPPI